MAKKRQPQGGDERRNRPMVEIRAPLLAPLDQLTARNGSDRAEEVNRAIRELLVREGLWPPAEDAAPAGEG